MYSFQSDDITCPACEGKHRPHTYKEGCKKFKKTEQSRPRPHLRRTPRNLFHLIKNWKHLVSLFSLMNSWWKLLDQVPVRRMEFHRHPQPEEQSEVKAELKVDIKVEEKKEPSRKGTLSLALQRVHDKPRSPTELLKLHLKHYQMSTEQFRRKTSALKLPKEIYNTYDQITKSCDACSKSKIAPSRAKVSGIRSEVFGELTFIMEKFQSILNPNFKSFFFMVVQLPVLLLT